MDRTAAAQALSDQDHGLAATLQAAGFDSASIRVVLRPALAHQSNRLYDIWADGTHAIAKEFLHPDELQDAPLREYQALQLLRPFGIAPVPIFYDSRLAPIVIYGFLEGTMWDRQRPTPQMLGLLAERWLQLTSIPPEQLWPSRNAQLSFHVIVDRFRSGLGQYAYWAQQNFPEGQAAAALCLELLDARQDVVQQLMSMEPVWCFGRGDARFSNVIQRPDGQIGMIDWEDSGLRDPARDLADLVAHPNQEDLLRMVEWQAFFQPYLAMREAADPTLMARMQCYLGLYPLF